MWVVLGGAGHLAGSRLYQGLVQGWAAAHAPESDRDFPPLMLDGRALPGVENQGLVNEECAREALVERAERWRALGASQVWCACISAHQVLEKRDQGFVDAAITSLQQLQARSVGVVGSRSVYEHPWLRQRLARAGLEGVFPSEEHQLRIDQWIYASMRGQHAPPRRLPEILASLREQGANTIWFSCTDLVRPPELIDGDVYDSIELVVPQLLQQLRAESWMRGLPAC